jgi:hypothetical protein
LHVVREGEADGGGHVVAPAQRVGRALSHDVPGGEHRDPVGQVFRLVHVMGGEKDCLAELPEPGNDLPGGAAGGRVETSGRLVQEDELWVADEGQGEIEPTPLATGEPGAERACLLGETDQGDGLVDIPRRAIEPGVQGQTLPDGQAGLGLRILQDHAHPVPPRTARRGRVVPQDRNLSLAALPEPFEDLNRRGLPCAVRAEEGEDLSPSHLEIDARDRLVTAVALNQAAHADHRLGLCRASGCLIDAVFLADAVHLVPQQLFQVAGRRSEPRRDKATASVSPPQSRPTVSTTMSGMLPTASP